ncbi:putative structural protein [Wenling hepe-like virus 1]|uniref:putative structural protein n=1 Tax=Wenling hepe-like virus 1 TaxID=1923493 RepID=UPI00090C03E5|nr:putative structural protein [Wenling hepe-like virus 1]APG77825.1 putative structural protein [Wenling hepe-like virus 1]
MLLNKLIPFLIKLSKMSSEGGVENTLALDTKFATSSGLRTINQPDEIQTHTIHKGVTIACSDASTTGLQVLSLPVDVNIDEIAKQMATGFEFYSIENCSLTLNSSSPLGTSSGSLQIGWIQDPYNLLFGDDGALNLKKAIRQDGSTMVRPRDSVHFPFAPQDRKYCRVGSDLRLSSFGGIFAVVRSKPEAGDQFTLQGDLTMTFKFSRMCVYTPDTTFVGQTKMRVAFDFPEQKGKFHTVKLPFAVQRPMSFLKLRKPIIATYLNEKQHNTNIFTVLKLRMLDGNKGLHKIVYDENVYNKLSFVRQNSAILEGEWTYNSLEDQNVDYL